MSLTRRLAAGLPAAGVAAFAALAFAGSPASAATVDTAGAAAHPAVMATPSCTDGSRDTCGYDDAEAPDGNGDTAGPGADDNGYGAAAPDDDRGHAGYGTPTPSTPGGVVDTVAPSTTPDSVAPSETPGGGVSAGGTLPLTGAPMAATMTLGGLLVAAGSAAIWYTRRRRNA